MANDSKYIFIFTLDLKTSGALEQEVTLHTTFGKNAKRLEHLSANTPRWIIEFICTPMA